MSAHPRHNADPTLRFLGPGAARNGPFGVLGLRPADLDDEAIVRAVHDRIAQIDAHPESRTPAADEARLAVHAAAANLLDPRVRSALLERLGSGSTSQSSPATRQTARTAGVPASRYQLEADLLRSIGAEGGWSAAARDRFIKLAHARGVDARTAAQSIPGLVGSLGGPLSGGRETTAGPPLTRSFAPADRNPFATSAPMRRQTSVVPQNAAPEQGPRVVRVADDRGVTAPFEMPDDPRDGASPFGVVLGVCAVIVVMVAVAGVTLLLISGDAPAPELNASGAKPAPRTTARAQSEPPAAPIEDEEGTAPSRRLDSAPAILHELEVASEGVPVDPDAAFAGFEAAVEALAQRWGGFSVADRLAAQDLVIGYIYRVSGRGDALERTFDALASGAARIAEGPPEKPSEIWSAAWSMGTLVRLRREQNLPISLVRRLDGAVRPAFPGGAPNADSFRAGAVALLQRLADPLSGAALDGKNPQVWSAWVEAVEAASIGDDDLITTMLIGALDARLRLGDAGPSGLSGGSPGAISVLIAAMDWSEGSRARAWLVRSFDDRSLGIDEMHAVTLALASSSTAGGVNYAMVLPRGAGDYDRRVLRDRFRELWGIAPDADRGQTLADFVSSATAVLGEDPPGDSSGNVATLASAVRLARLNAVAAMLWRAENDPAAAWLDDLDGPVDAVVHASGVPDLAGLLRTSGGNWASEYLSAGSHIERRLELLGTAGGRERLGAMEAEVIVAEALRGSPLRVREAATAIVEAEASTPTIVNAVLEALPLMPKTARNGAIVERVGGVPLPGINEPEWAHEARRAVVERLLELIAGHGEYARLDALGSLLDGAYEARLATPGGVAAQVSDPGTNADSSGVAPSAGARTGAPAPARQSARELAARWLAAAERRPPAPIWGYSIDEIRSRQAARLSASDGIVQLFHTRQLALAEVMGQVIAGEGPGRASEVSELLESFARDRRRAHSVLIQIERTERAMLRLWLMRYEEEA